MAERTRRYGATDGKAHYRYSSRYPFSGLIRCGDCGYGFRRILNRTNNAIGQYWVCSSHNHNTVVKCDNAVRIREEEILQALREHIGRVLEDWASLPGEILSMRKSHLAPGLDREERLRETELRRLNNKLKRFQELFSEGLLTIAEFREKRDLIRKRSDQLSSPPAAKQEKAISEEDIRKAIQQILQLQDICFSELHKIIREINVKNNGSVTIILRSFGPDGAAIPV